MSASVDFIVLGLPRSGTAWLANWLTTDRSLCLHDPFASTLPEMWEAGGKRFGISCTGAYLFPRWLVLQDCPVAIIDRDPAECDASLSHMGLPDTAPLRKPFAAAAGRRWRFNDIWNEEKARELWAFLLPGLPFDTARYRLLRTLNVQTTNTKPDMDVLGELMNRYSQGVGSCPGAQ